MSVYKILNTFQNIKIVAKYDAFSPGLKLSVRVLDLYLRKFDLVLPFYYRSLFERAGIHKETSRRRHVGERWEKKVCSNLAFTG